MGRVLRRPRRRRLLPAARHRDGLVRLRRGRERSRGVALPTEHHDQLHLEVWKVMMSKTISHWIDNRPFAGSSTETAPVTNPATGEVTGEVALASVEDARAVIDAAAAAFPARADPAVGQPDQ